MPTNYNWTSAVPTELLVVSDVKRFLRISHNSEDEDLERWITASRQAVEAVTGVAVGDRAITLYRDDFPAGRQPLQLPVAPANSITSINYLDEDESSQGYATYTLRNTHIPEILPNSGESWPGVSHYHSDAVTVVYDGGYTAATVPPGIKMAMLHYIAASYEYRGQPEAVSEAFFHLLAPYRQGDEFNRY